MKMENNSSRKCVGFLQFQYTFLFVDVAHIVDSAFVKQTYTLLVCPTWREDRVTRSPECARMKFHLDKHLVGTYFFYFYFIFLISWV
jgi:hypothetical protein